MLAPLQQASVAVVAVGESFDVGCLGDVVVDYAVAVAAAVEPSAFAQAVRALAGLGMLVGSAAIFALNCVAVAVGDGSAGLGALASCAAGETGCFVEHEHSPASVLSVEE